MGYGHKSLEDDVFAYFGDDWYSGTGGDTWNETYIDYAMYLFDRADREGGVRSTYWDLSFPILFDNLLTGLAHRLPDGRVQPGYNDWNVRHFFQRLWSVAHDNGLNPGAIGCHSTNDYILVSFGWIDAVLDGERDIQLDMSDARLGRLLSDRAGCAPCRAPTTGASASAGWASSFEGSGKNRSRQRRAGRICLAPRFVAQSLLQPGPDRHAAGRARLGPQRRAGGLSSVLAQSVRDLRRQGRPRLALAIARPDHDGSLQLRRQGRRRTSRSRSTWTSST